MYIYVYVSLIGTYSTFVQRFITSEDVSCWNIYTKRHVSESLLFPEMGLYFLMFIIAICFFLS